MTTKKVRSGRRDEHGREYGLSELVNPRRGGNRARESSGLELVLLDDDVAKAFPTGAGVNEALRFLVAAVRAEVRKLGRARRRA